MTREQVEAMTRDLVGDEAQFTIMMPPADGELSPIFRPSRRLAKTKARLLADLASTRRTAPIVAASRLGGWDNDDGVTAALREALDAPNAYTRLFAAESLGKVRDGDPSTWRRVLALAADAGSQPSALAEGIVRLARLDPDARFAEGRDTILTMVDRYPAWTRHLRALAVHLEAV
jgi:hypothetical protein